mmetsp:Transcript_6807/g.19158  ORF Transcript_6807/g.19158 Transcript_6807/m.19158 type:complete len:195 (+) Transcript_6807:2256-2840(+)
MADVIHIEYCITCGLRHLSVIEYLENYHLFLPATSVLNACLLIKPHHSLLKVFHSPLVRAISVLAPNVLEGLDSAELTHLDLSLCTSLRNTGLSGAIPRLSQLHSLHLGMCTSCSPAGVLAIVSSLPMLRYLNLSAVGGWKGIADSVQQGTGPGSPRAAAVFSEAPARLRVEHGMPLSWRAKVLATLSLAQEDV